MKQDITELFCLIDDFTTMYDEVSKKYQIGCNKNGRKPTRTPDLIDSEIMTIVLLFQSSPSKNFKYFYKSYLQLYKSEFPNMPSYERFISLKSRVLFKMMFMLFLLLRKTNKKEAFIDSTSLAVCHPKRIRSNKVFKDLANIGKTTKGWFYGFKLHIIIDTTGNLMNIMLTQANFDDRQAAENMTKKFTNLLLFGDKGYISKTLFLKLYRLGIKLVTGIKKNMKNCLMLLREKILLRKRSIVETVFDYLKNKLQLEHTRHRSPTNALIHVLATLIHYQLKKTKPSITEDYCVLFGNP
jgi:hypothetical protein